MKEVDAIKELKSEVTELKKSNNDLMNLNKQLRLNNFEINLRLNNVEKELRNEINNCNEKINALANLLHILILGENAKSIKQKIKYLRGSKQIELFKKRSCSSIEKNLTLSYINLPEFSRLQVSLFLNSTLLFFTVQCLTSCS